MCHGLQNLFHLSVVLVWKSETILKLLKGVLTLLEGGGVLCFLLSLLSPFFFPCLHLAWSFCMGCAIHVQCI